MHIVHSQYYFNGYTPRFLTTIDGLTEVNGFGPNPKDPGKAYPRLPKPPLSPMSVEGSELVEVHSLASVIRVCLSPTWV